MSAQFGDRVGEQYWDDVWSAAPPTGHMDPTTPGFRNRVDRGFASLFRQMVPTGPFEALEVGCANSLWLPYLATEHGARVCGLDYSELGCEGERAILRDAKVDGEVVCADLFEPPADLVDRFDIVVTFGVVEHFDDTTGVISALRTYVKPEGVLLTIIPNMVGAIGTIEHWINHPVYDLHVRLTPRALACAHTSAGMTVTAAHYFLSTNFGVLNVNGLDPEACATRAKRALCVNLGRVSKGVWALEERLRPLKATRTFAPYVVVTARR
jgi:2-polyprenyl-3-methyl-5-hydroxy-6-metoxy-1,4-benzoquinol methylase